MFANTMFSSKPFSSTLPSKFKPIALGVMFGCALLAQLPGASAQAAQTAAPASDDVTRATLDNGLRVVIVRDRLAPMVTTQITYLAGGYQTPAGLDIPGVSLVASARRPQTERDG